MNATDAIKRMQQVDPAVYNLPSLASVYAGNSVMLRSGGPEMLAESNVSDPNGSVICSWTNNGKEEQSSFPLACLTSYGAK